MYSFEFRKYDNFSTLLEFSPNCAIERNAYRSVEFESINFVQVIGLADFDALYRARSSLMLGQNGLPRVLPVMLLKDDDESNE